MKFNEKELAEASNGPADLEGRLNHKRAHKAGQIDRRQPAGVIVLENYTINIDTTSEGAFAFSIAFRDEHEKRHVLSGRSESQVEQWINALKQASYEYWRSQLIVLQERLCKKTGKDPLLMYPRNQGVIRDEAWESTSSFQSHVRSFTSSVTTSSTLNLVTREINLIEF